MLSRSLRRLRIVGLTEGVSFLLLLGIAMPLKYVWGMPEYVRATGMIHGLLWIAFAGCVLELRIVHRWPYSRCALAMLASVLPFGPFVLDSSLRRDAAATPGGSPVPARARATRAGEQH